jgi:hypothetical protein
MCNGSQNVTQTNNPAALGVANQYDDFVIWHNRENTAYDFIRISAITKEKKQADRDRNLTFTGMFDYVQSSGNHYESAIAEAARRQMLLIKALNSPERIVKLSYDAKTAAIKSLINNLSAYPEDVAITNLQGWLTALQTKNQAFEALTLQYVEKVVGKPEYTMRQSREGIEKSIRTMFNCVNALIVMNGETNYVTYVNALNAIIKHYNDVNAARLGRYEANQNKNVSEKQLPNE